MLTRRKFLVTGGTIGAAAAAWTGSAYQDKESTKPGKSSLALQFERDSEAKLLSDLRQCRPAGALSVMREPGKWKYISYETEHFGGYQLLESGDNTGDAAELILPLGVEGWHAIYLGFCPYSGLHPYIIRVRLTADEHFEKLFNELRTNPMQEWRAYEVLWRVEDLTGKDLLIQNIPGRHCTISWAKLIPLTEAEIKKYAPKDFLAAVRDVRISLRHTRMGLRDDRYPYWWVG